MSEFAGDIRRQLWAELMEEPPGGANHGRRKTATGRLAPLEQVDWSSGSPQPLTPGGISSRAPQEKRKHGTAYTYMKIRCRCQPCRAWRAAYVKDWKERRNGNASSP